MKIFLIKSLLLFLTIILVAMGIGSTVNVLLNNSTPSSKSTSQLSSKPSGSSGLIETQEGKIKSFRELPDMPGFDMYINNDEKPAFVGFLFVQGNSIKDSDLRLIGKRVRDYLSGYNNISLSFYKYYDEDMIINYDKIPLEDSVLIEARNCMTKATMANYRYEGTEQEILTIKSSNWNTLKTSCSN